MFTRQQCQPFIGRPVQFRTRYGYHQGVVERITSDSVIVLSPRQYIPAQLVSESVPATDVERLDLALALGGYGAGYGGYPVAPYGVRPGYGGYGPWAFGWGRWAVAFLAIFALWGLLW